MPTPTLSRGRPRPASSLPLLSARRLPAKTPVNMQKKLSVVLAEHRAGILEAWMRRVLDDPAVPEAHRLPVPALRDHIPRLLDELIAALERERPIRDEEAAGYRFGKTIIPVEHARQRVGAGYTLASALRELSHFRSVLLEFALGELQDGPVDTAGVRLMHAALDECMAFSAAEMEREAHGALALERELRERFIAVLAHDLRSPLSNVIMATELLLRQRLPEEQVRSLERILRGGQRIGRMVGDLLDFAEVRSGQIGLRRSRANLRELCGDIVENLQAAHPNRQIVFESQGDGAGEWDPNRLAQILSNLVGNALDYGPADVPVTLALHEEGADAVLEVHNAGPAIPAEDLPHLFEPFRRGSAGAQPKGGLGLGLYISSEIAKAHGGAIEVRSRDAEGTSFRVRLPREAHA